MKSNRTKSHRIKKNVYIFHVATIIWTVRRKLLFSVAMRHTIKTPTTNQDEKKNLYIYYIQTTPTKRNQMWKKKGNCVTPQT